MPRLIRSCTIGVIPLEQQEEANLHAIEVNPLNAPSGSTNFEAAVDGKKLWPPGATLRVRFLEGDPVVQKKVEAIAHEWSQVANIKFQFGNDRNAEIRITFDPRTGSWSYIGTDSTLTRLLGQPSMNYGWLKPNTANSEYRRVVLHEFGHALGLIHEHQSPNVAIPWDEQKVIAYYKKTNGWEESYIRSNVLSRMLGSHLIATTFDPKSIMLYPVPKELTTNGFSSDWNMELSETDKAFIATRYPFSNRPTT